jgi:hypothetical protein
MKRHRVEAQFEFEARRLTIAEGCFHADSVRCPICLRLFGRDALAEQQLTMEHVLPRRVGGRTQTITCKHCNNTQGGRLDSHVVTAARSRAAFAGHGTVRTTVAIDGAAFQADVAWHPDPSVTNVIKVVSAASNPTQVDAASRQLDAGAREINLSFSLGYIQNREWLGLLRAAYLATFHRHGYVYALAPSVTPIRRQITGEDTPSPYLSRIVRMISTPPFRLRSGFAEVDVAPRMGYAAHLVLLQTTMAQIATHLVLLPRATSETADPFQGLADIADTLNGQPLTLPLSSVRR